MTRNIILPLVMKDWYLQRGTLKLVLVGGLAGLGLQFFGGVVAVFGLTATFACSIVLGVALSLSTVVNEKNKQNEPFVMSLPVTPLEYAGARLLANLSMFLLVWLVLMAGLFFTFTARGLPGFLPGATVAAVAILVGFCTMLCVGMVVRSEKIWTLTMVVVNFGYGAVWLLLAQTPDIARQAFGPVPVWSPHILSYLSAELIFLVVVLALGAWGQSRRTSFL